jgi:hypothetical protein
VKGTEKTWVGMELVALNLSQELRKISLQPTPILIGNKLLGSSHLKLYTGNMQVQYQPKSIAFMPNKLFRAVSLKQASYPILETK